ncbi:MAG TPA: hypothetical protein ENI80_04190 [Acidiferrobacteraceae bacterium]|nr:hypothetical protein [Acidiferrobacteraceae bacterium]
MDSALVFSKTTKGEHEIESREYHLNQHHRIALILVDGHSDVAHLHHKAGGLAELESLLESLAVDGFISTDSPTWQPTVGTRNEDKLISLKAALIDTAVMILGSDAGRVTKKLRDAVNDKDGLIYAVQQCKKLISLAIDEKKASEFQQKCDALINQA